MCTNARTTNPPIYALPTFLYTHHRYTFTLLIARKITPHVTSSITPIAPPTFSITTHTHTHTHTGTSLVPLMHDPSTPVKTAAFSQYPRGYQKPEEGHPLALIHCIESVLHDLFCCVKWVLYALLYSNKSVLYALPLLLC